MTVHVASAKLTTVQTAAIKDQWDPGMGLAVGQPVRITSSDRIPANGIRISRTYAVPLPAGWVATLAYFDDALGTWHAVPSSLSPDRRTVSAVVHHLSDWTDILGDVTQSAGNALSGVADWAYYQVGKIFDTRVAAPACTGNPGWVQSTTFIGTERNNSLLFCTGHDPKQPQLLDVKVRVNRGFGFDAYVQAPAAWQYNSTFGETSLQDAIAIAGHVSDTVSQELGDLAPAGSVVVGPGQELSFGATEQAVRGAAGPTVLKLVPPSTTGFLISMLGQLVTTQMSEMVDGYVAAAIAISGCYSDVRAAHDFGSWTRALTTCVSGIDESIARQLATYLTKRGEDPVQAGKLAGEVIGKVTVYLALIGPAFSTMNFIAERKLPDSARTVSVFPKPEPVTLGTLRSAQVPADCRLPAQRLLNGKTTMGSPGMGGIEVVKGQVGFADFAGLGYDQALAAYGCNAGGVGWPQVLVLIGAQGKLLASLDLSTFSDTEHAGVTAMSTHGRTAHVIWDAYNGAGFGVQHHAGDFSYANGKLVLANHTVDYTAYAVALDINTAAYDAKRSELKDPNVMTDAQWNELVQAKGLGLSVNSTCETTGDTATCEYEGASPGDNPHNFLTLQKAPGTLYGWRVASLEIPTPSL